MNALQFSKMKRWMTRLISIAVMGTLLGLVSPVPARADTSVCGPVSGVWAPAGNNYIVTCDIQVLGGTTLTIQPGVVVKFDPVTSLRVDGELIAQGATFTSNSPSPAKGDWGRIWFTATSVDAVFDANGNYVSGGKIQGSLVEWGGGGVNGEIEVNGASPFINNNTIRNSSTRGVYAVGRSSSQKIKIAGNSITGNSGGGINVSTGELDRNVIFANDAMNGPGAGVYATNSLLIENEVTLNSGGSGAGIYALGSILSYNTVSSNSGNPCTVPSGIPCFPNPARDGGGVFSNGSDLIGNIITGNRLGNHYADEAFGGGVYAVGGTLSQNTVTGNVITWGGSKGGGIYSSLSVLTGNEVNANSVSGHNSAGGGIYISGGSALDNMISWNTVNSDANETSYGGGIYADGGIVMNNTIQNNSAAGGADSHGGGLYADISSVQINIFTGNTANRGGAIYAFKGTITSNEVLTNTTSLSGTLYVDQGTATMNILRANSAVAGGAIYGTGAMLTGNIAEENAANFGAGIYAIDSTVNGNTLSGNDAVSDGGGLYARGGAVTNNTLTANTVPSWGHGSGAYIAGVTDFSYNSVLNNTAPSGTSGGISISGQPVLQYNNLYGNQPYDAEVVSSQDVTGIRNYWGLSACTAIPAQIYDGSDAPGRGHLAYAPSLYSPAPVAQLPAPGNLALNEESNSVTLNWSPIPSIPNVGCRNPGSNAPDLVYRVYYDTDSACGPYDGTGLPAGDSPITVGANTQITLSGASQDGFVFVVTAYDYLGRESAYSNSVGNLAGAQRIFLSVLISSP